MENFPKHKFHDVSKNFTKKRLKRPNCQPTCSSILKISFSKVLKRFVPPARKFFNMKPFGITIHKEIDNLQMDLIHQVLRDYKLKGRRKF